MKISELGWAVQHSLIYDDFQNQLCNMVKLAHQKTNQALCTYKYTSELFWEVMVTKCCKENLKKDIADQRHEPVALVGSAFEKVEKWWTLVEKEAFKIPEMFRRLYYLFLSRRDPHIYISRQFNIRFQSVRLGFQPGKEYRTQSTKMETVLMELLVFHREHIREENCHGRCNEPLVERIQRKEGVRKENFTPYTLNRSYTIHLQ